MHGRKTFTKFDWTNGVRSFSLKGEVQNRVASHNCLDLRRRGVINHSLWATLSKRIKPAECIFWETPPGVRIMRLGVSLYGRREARKHKPLELMRRAKLLFAKTAAGAVACERMAIYKACCFVQLSDCSKLERHRSSRTQREARTWGTIDFCPSKKQQCKFLLHVIKELADKLISTGTQNLIKANQIK